MKVKALRRRALGLMNYPVWGQRRLDMRFYGGTKWTRRQVERMLANAPAPFVINKIRASDILRQAQELDRRERANVIRVDIKSLSAHA